MRVKAKKLPGQGWTRYAYNDNNQLLLERTPAGIVKFHIPDNLGRVCVEGVCKMDSLMPFRYYERLIGKTYAVRLDDPYLIEKEICQRYPENDPLVPIEKGLRFQELQSTEETYKNGNVGPNKGSGNTRLQPVEFTDDNEKIIFNNSQSTNVGPNKGSGNTGLQPVDTCFDYVIYAYKLFPQPNFIPTKVIYYDDYTYFQKNVFPDSLNKAFQQTAIKYVGCPIRCANFSSLF